MVRAAGVPQAENQINLGQQRVLIELHYMNSNGPEHPAAISGSANSVVTVFRIACSASRGLCCESVLPLEQMGVRVSLDFFHVRPFGL